MLQLELECDASAAFFIVHLLEVAGAVILRNMQRKKE